MYFPIFFPFQVAMAQDLLQRLLIAGEFHSEIWFPVLVLLLCTNVAGSTSLRESELLIGSMFSQTPHSMSSNIYISSRSTSI
jgi:hypothetical protein